MDTNYEAIKSLIELLVKKAGFSIEKNDIELEFNKISDLLIKYEKNKIKEDLKIKKERIETNSELLGKNVLKKYKFGSDYSEINNELELLINNIDVQESKNHDTSLMSYIYNSIYHYNEKYEKMNDKLQTYNYVEEKMDLFDNEIFEIKTINSQINKAKEEQINQLKLKIESFTEIKNKISDSLKKEKEKIELLNNTQEKLQENDISVDLFEKFLLVKESIEKKCEIYEKVIEIIKDYINKNNEFVKTLEKEIEYLKQENFDFNDLLLDSEEENNIEKLIDEIKLESICNKLSILKNQRDVIYVDYNQVKQEIKREWSKRKNNNNNIEEKIPVSKAEKVEIPQNKNIKVSPIVETKERIELDW